jgi:hypothetical protein
MLPDKEGMTFLYWGNQKNLKRLFESRLREAQNFQSTTEQNIKIIDTWTKSNRRKCEVAVEASRKLEALFYDQFSALLETIATLAPPEAFTKIRKCIKKSPGGSIPTTQLLEASSSVLMTEFFQPIHALSVFTRTMARINQSPTLWTPKYRSLIQKTASLGTLRTFCLSSGKMEAKQTTNILRAQALSLFCAIGEVKRARSRHAGWTIPSSSDLVADLISTLCFPTTSWPIHFMLKENFLEDADDKDMEFVEIASDEDDVQEIQRHD